MKKFTTKFIAIAIAAAMTSGMYIDTFAAQNGAPSQESGAAYEWGAKNNINTNAEVLYYWGGDWADCVIHELHPKTFKNGTIIDDGYDREIFITSNKADKFREKWNVEYLTNLNWYDRELDEDDFNYALDVLDSGFDAYGKDTIAALTYYHPMHMMLVDAGKSKIDESTLKDTLTTAKFDGGDYRFIRYGEDFRVINACVTLSPNKKLDVNDVIDGFSLAITQYLMINNNHYDIKRVTVPKWMRDSEGNIMSIYSPETILIPTYLSEVLRDAMKGIDKPAYGSQKYLRAKWLYEMSVNTFGVNNNMSNALANYINI